MAVTKVIAITPYWYLCSLPITLIPRGSSGISVFWQARDSRLSIIKPHIWSLLLITGCLQYVDNLQVFPLGVKWGWNVLILFYPYSHSDLQDGLSVPLY